MQIAAFASEHTLNRILNMYMKLGLPYCAKHKETWWWEVHRECEASWFSVDTVSCTWLTHKLFTLFLQLGFLVHLQNRSDIGCRSWRHLPDSQEGVLNRTVPYVYTVSVFGSSYPCQSNTHTECGTDYSCHASRLPQDVQGTKTIGEPYECTDIYGYMWCSLIVWQQDHPRHGLVLAWDCSSRTPVYLSGYCLVQETPPQGRLRITCKCRHTAYMYLISA